MRILGLDHIQIAMPEGEDVQARSYYGNLLGLNEVDKPGSLAGRGGVWFENGDVKVHLGVDAQFVPARKAHPGFKVADLDSLSQQLRVHGFKVEVAEQVPGFRRIFTADPFGNKIEFLQAD